MDWITGIQNALDYIEENLCGDIDYKEAARRCCCSEYHFQRLFSILCGYTLGEYIRCRRLALAGAELSNGGAKVIDIALKYGYESPDSFTKAFKAFHGVLPSQARGNALKSFTPLTVRLSLDGGNTMHYTITERPALTLTGFSTRFSGNPAERFEQEKSFYISTREQQLVLKALARDLDTSYSVLGGFTDDGYDFAIASYLSTYVLDRLPITLGEKAKNYRQIEIPAGLYFVCETERCTYPTALEAELRQEAVSAISSLGYELDSRPELTVSHWYWEEGNSALNSSRYIEMLLPIKKKER